MPLRSLVDTHRLSIGRLVVAETHAIRREALDKIRRQWPSSLSAKPAAWEMRATAPHVVSRIVDTLRERLDASTKRLAHRAAAESLRLFDHASKARGDVAPPSPPPEPQPTYDGTAARDQALRRLATRLIVDLEACFAKSAAEGHSPNRAMLAAAGPTGALAGGASFVNLITRTELMTAINQAIQRTTVALSLVVPDMRRLIVSTFDEKTAPDSIFVHGELRRVDEPFIDGAGRVYLVPPARPNDREIILPWRASWPVPSWGKPKPDEEREAAWHNAHPLRLT